MLKRFQRDYPIFCHGMILIFSQAIPQSMHRERLKLSSTLYRQLPKLAFNIAILAWIWVVWLWNINDCANILKVKKIYLKIKHQFDLLWFITAALQHSLHEANGRGVLVDSRCRCNRGCFIAVKGVCFLFFFWASSFKWEGRKKATQLCSAGWDHPMPTLSNTRNLEGEMAKS